MLQGTRQLTWRQFDEATNRVAHGLATLGLTADARLAVLMSNSIEMVELLFGAGKGRVSVVPINLSVTDAAVAAMIRDSGAAAVVASGEHCQRIDASSARQSPCNTHTPGCRPCKHRLDRLADMAGRTTRQSPCNCHSTRYRMQHHLQLRHHRTAKRHRAYARLPIILGHRPCDCAALSQWRGHASVRSGCTRTSAGSRCCATILAGGTIVLVPAFNRGGARRDIARHRVTHGGFVPVQLQRSWNCRRLQHTTSRRCRPSCVAARRCRLRCKRASRDTLDCELIELYGLTEGIVTDARPGRLRPQDRIRRQADPRPAYSSSCVTTIAKCRGRAEPAKSAATAGS